MTDEETDNDIEDVLEFESSTTQQDPTDETESDFVTPVELNEESSESSTTQQDLTDETESDFVTPVELNEESSNAEEDSESPIVLNEETDNDSDFDDNPVLNSIPSEKKTLHQQNKGTFFDRNKMIVIISGIGIALLLFFVLVFPSLKKKDKKSTEKETDKAGKTFIPTDVTRYTPQQESESPLMEDSNSALSSNNDSIEDKYGELFAAQLTPPANTAPVQVPKSNSSDTSNFPITNRNEQQKNLNHMSFDLKRNNTSGPVSNFSSTGNGSSSAYTPRNLSTNYSNLQGQNSYTSQNNQADKEKFIQQTSGSGNYQWNSEFSLWKGTIISAVLDTSINTDLPGPVMAHVSKNIYSSKTGEYLLIPQGSRLYGEYNSNISYGQNRVQVVWHTLIRPDGLEINLGSLNGIDSYGYSGYKGLKTEHPFEYAKAMGLIAMFSIIDAKAYNTIDTTNNMYAQNALSSIYSEQQQLNNKIVDRALDIQPTNRIFSGKEINLITNVSIDLPPLQAPEVTEKYYRK